MEAGAALLIARKAESQTFCEMRKAGALTWRRVPIQVADQSTIPPELTP